MKLITVVTGLPLSGTLNIVPLLLAPPAEVVPHKTLPVLSAISRPAGLAPLLMPVKFTRVVRPVKAGDAKLNNVPRLLAPPVKVAPYKLPLLAWNNLAIGLVPLLGRAVPVKLISVVRVLKPAPLNLNALPLLDEPPAEVVP